MSTTVTTILWGVIGFCLGAITVLVYLTWRIRRADRLMREAVLRLASLSRPVNGKTGTVRIFKR